MLHIEGYEQMVADLFKKDPSNGFMAHHATTGIAGEVAELLNAEGRKNLMEELGDLRFYMVALRQRLSTALSENLLQTTEVVDSRYYTPTVGSVFNNLTVLGGELLDLTKKSWIYGRELPDYKIAQMLALFDKNLDFAVEMFGLNWPVLEEQNMLKLLKGDNARYKSGAYSDAQALARADKNADGTDKGQVIEADKFHPREVSLTPEGVQMGGSVTYRSEKDQATMQANTAPHLST